MLIHISLHYHSCRHLSFNKNNYSWKDVCLFKLASLFLLKFLFFKLGFYFLVLCVCKIFVQEIEEQVALFIPLPRCLSFFELLISRTMKKNLNFLEQVCYCVANVHTKKVSSGDGLGFTHWNLHYVIMWRLFKQISWKRSSEKNLDFFKNAQIAEVFHVSLHLRAKRRHKMRFSVPRQREKDFHTAPREDRTLDPWFTRPVL